MEAAFDGKIEFVEGIYLLCDSSRSVTNLSITAVFNDGLRKQHIGATPRPPRGKASIALLVLIAVS